MATLQALPESIALRSYATLADACRTLSNEGGWSAPEEICASLARAVSRIFLGLAHADRRFDDAECELLSTLCRLDSTYDGQLAATLRETPESAADASLPEIVRAAIEFDRREGTCLARDIVEALESLAYAVIGSDGSISLEELEALGVWVRRLYEALGDSKPVQGPTCATIGA
ncbi:MAG: hypothetical protein N2109_05295 [Fimbriimonadales bacterium]|nr:hypothetical protein [Fimbriimonadales bacterium]